METGETASSDRRTGGAMYRSRGCRSGSGSRGGRSRDGGRGVLAHVGAVLAIAASTAAVAPAAAGAVTISPLPGTPDASPETQISILGTAPANIASVTVTGAISGVHTGHLAPYSNGQGASFLLDAPLSEGEEVSVVVDLSEGGPLSDSFTVSRPGGDAPPIVVPGEKPEEQQHFVSAPNLQPPKVRINKLTPGMEGDIFLDPAPAPLIRGGKKLIEFEPVGPDGLMILNAEGKLLWWNQLPADMAATNVQLTSYEGKPALAWWQGLFLGVGYGRGEGVILNSSYQPVATVKAGNGYSADLHELIVTPTGQAYLDSYTPVCMPTCSESKPAVLDGVIQEIDIHTGLVMWEWHALGHVPITDTEIVPAGGFFDPYHVNSIQPLPEGRVLVSMRNTSAIYELQQESGAILWTLGGKKSSFALNKRARFYFQHDARLEGKQLTLFDDHAGPPSHGPARGLALRLNMATKKAAVQEEYTRPVATSVFAEGSTQLLPDGDVTVGFGASQFFSVFTKKGPNRHGEQLLEGELPLGDGTYRVRRYPWNATPATLPAAAAIRESPTEVAVYASWNGATKVASWEVLAGESAETLSPVATAAWSGFETRIGVAGAASTFEVRALDGEGKVLATSEPVSAP